MDDSFGVAVVNATEQLVNHFLNLLLGHCSLVLSHKFLQIILNKFKNEIKLLLVGLKHDFFEATDAFFSLDLAWTLEALRRHFFTNNDARGLLGSLQGRNRLLIQLRVLYDAGAIRIGPRGLDKAGFETATKTYLMHFGDSSEKSSLNVFSQNPYYLGRLAGAITQAPLKKWIDFQLAFAEAFEGLISRPNEQEEVCRELAVKCLA